MRWIQAFAVLLWVDTVVAQADTIPAINDSVRTIEIHPVFISAARNPFPQSVSRITTKELYELHEPMIEPALNATPGIWMQSGTLNTNRISIRGIGYREPFATTGIKVYLDEIPLTNGVGEASIEDIHPHILSGIEIIRGPSSALWGAGLGGMILLRSASPQQDMFGARVQGGSFNRLQIDQQVSLKYGARDQWGTMLHYQYLNDDGFRENNGYKKYSMTWIQQLQTGKWMFRGFLHSISLHAFIPSSLTRQDFETRPKIAASTWSAVKGNEDYTKFITGLSFGFDGKQNWMYRGSVFGTRFSSDEVRPFNILDERNYAYGMRHRVGKQIASSAFLTGGVELYSEQYDAATFETLDGGVPGAQLSEIEDRRVYLHTFLQGEWDVARRLHVFGGASTAWSDLSHSSLSLNVPASVYPTVGIQYALSHLISLSASASRGYTALSLAQALNSDGTISQGIEPETGWSMETGLRIGDNHNFAKITAFSMHVENTIVSTRFMDDQFIKFNGGKTGHKGVEAEIGLADKRERWEWNAAYTLSDHVFTTFEENGVNYAGKSLPGVPRHRLFQRLSLLPLSVLKLSVTHHWVSDVYLNDANTQEGEGHHLINASASYSFHTGEKLQWIVSGHMHNLFDTYYAPMFQINAPGAMPRYYYPGKPRAVYFSIGVEYTM